ncbi:hypothetical protein LNU06_00350 [Campylobacter sp. VicNov18]|uniref:hypothetical protein n=1 Tax=Campylobacter bilis TaxID=2691918 RepID=UPI00130DFB32|nr:hypothetical protein [Campylobacter bilis]MPV62993.1 hypothetical protein [Campylobacter hepaticus]MBM0636492.1 hypothetical protein [Campylobacter bilis]MCC8277203.1 hypothetical protein [Campylobacter bilis]MCC8298946.1 hypothetical protein [Campylobacter bilis]MCC8300112.1 hypothetical protein [Campylobacter bilis]
MDQSYEFFLALHLYSLYASGFLMLFYLILTQGNFKTEFIFIRRIRLFLPIYYLFLALMIFTGCLLLVMKQLHMNFNIAIMIFSWILIFALAIFHFICFKKARRFRRYTSFRWLSFVILLCEIFILFLPFLAKRYL